MFTVIKLLWKLEVNIKKSKIMIFNRGNELINNDLRYKSAVLENVKRIKYLGFSISPKKCNFSPTIDDLSIRANRAIFALNNKISKLPKKLAIKLFNSLIAHIWIMIISLGNTVKLNVSKPSLLKDFWDVISKLVILWKEGRLESGRCY